MFCGQIEFLCDIRLYYCNLYIGIRILLKYYLICRLIDKHFVNKFKHFDQFSGFGCRWNLVSTAINDDYV